MEPSFKVLPLNQQFILANYNPGVRGNSLGSASLIQGEFKDPSGGSYYFGLPMDVYRQSYGDPKRFDLVEAAGQDRGRSSKQRLDQTA